MAGWVSCVTFVDDVSARVGVGWAATTKVSQRTMAHQEKDALGGSLKR